MAGSSTMQTLMPSGHNGCRARINRRERRGTLIKWLRLTTARPFLEARLTFQDAIHDLYVYGSDEAWELHEDVSVAVSRSLGPIRLDDVRQGLDGRLPSVRHIKPFNPVACRELLSDPDENVPEHCEATSSTLHNQDSGPISKAAPP